MISIPFAPRTCPHHYILPHSYEPNPLANNLHTFFLHLFNIRCTHVSQPTLLAPVLNKQLTRINLLNLRQRQANLIPIQRRLRPLQRVALEVHRRQHLLIPQFALDFLETAQLAITRPELGQVCQAIQTAEMLDGVCADVDYFELSVVFEAGDLGEEVVGDVEFFEVGEGFEAGDCAEAVGLYGEDTQVCECGEALDLCEFVLAEPEFFELRQGA